MPDEERPTGRVMTRRGPLEGVLVLDLTHAAAR